MWTNLDDEYECQDKYQVVAIEGEPKNPGEDPFYYSSNEKLQSKKPLHHCFDENL